MKKLLFTAILFISAISFAQETTDTNAGIFDFETEVLDYGKINLNDDGNRVFTFKNIGKTPIIISNIKGSCGCTVATKPNEPIMPGKTGEIGVKYATNRVGGFSKTITITSNASESKKVLRVKGIVLKQESAANNGAISVTK
jgi:hypothetical protein